VNPIVQHGVVECGHDGESAAVEAAAFVVTVLQPVTACTVPFPPQAATNNPAATSGTALRVTAPWGDGA